MYDEDSASSSSDTKSARRRRSSSPPTSISYKRARRGSGSSPNGKSHPPMPTASGSSSSMPPLSLSILGVEPLDEFIREVADFVHHMIVSRPDIPTGQVEVEAKIGVLKDKMSGARLSLPLLVETILAPNSLDCRFESNMSEARHKHYNNLLNTLKASTTNSSQASPLAYKHVHLLDSFYPSDNPHYREKIRVTRDEKTGQVTECTRKIRLGDLNVYSPKRAADWRISVSLEVPVSHPVGSSTHSRKKDRMSYSHEEFIIDLTQVTTSASPSMPAETLHELELEIARPALLLAAAAKRGDPGVPQVERDAFDELIRAFVNNARILVRNSGDAQW